MDSNKNSLTDCVNKFLQLSQPLDTFLASDPQKSQHFIDLTKSLFDFNKQLVKQNVDKKSNALSVKTSLDQLYTTGFDEEQVWQQIQLNNEPLLDLLVKHVADLSVRNQHLGLKHSSGDPREPNEDQSQEKQKKLKRNETKVKNPKKTILKEVVTEDFPQNVLPTKTAKRVTIVEPIKKSVVDDEFFKLDQLEEFLNNEDKKEEQRVSGVQEMSSEESEDEIDLFEDDSEIEEEDTDDGPNGREAMFGDFFDPPIDGNENQFKPKELKEELDGESDESEEIDEELEETNGEIDTRDIDLNDIEDKEEDNEMGIDYASSSDSEDQLMIDQSKKSQDINKLDDNKSEFERIQDKLKEKIEKQERLNLMDKSWQMRGEITSERRPENSLLEEHLHFDHTQRPAPMITEETTIKLEDIIKQRVKDNAFDDVIRKVKPKEKPFEYRRRITMESEKNKQSLAEIYENEYLKQKQTDKEEQQNPIHQEIRKRMRNLFLQLDGLSNFNFTPRPPQPEVKIINNLPAIHAEEVTPVTATDVSLLAPQEVFDNRKRELQSNAEKSKTDRNRSRRVKKKIQSKQFKHKESKEKTIKSKDVIKSSSFETKHLSSSKKFFEKLQEKSSQVIEKSKSKNNSKNSIKQSNKIKL